LTAKLKQAEARAEFAEKSVQKLQKEVRNTKKNGSVTATLPQKSLGVTGGASSYIIINYRYFNTVVKWKYS
jgi:hypothetical protein